MTLSRLQTANEAVESPMKKILATLAISAAMIVPAAAIERSTMPLGSSDWICFPLGEACKGVNRHNHCWAPWEACSVAHWPPQAPGNHFSNGGRGWIGAAPAQAATAPAQSRPEKAAKTAKLKPKDTCNGTLTSNGCVPTPTPPPPPPINTTIGGNQVAPNANQAATANTSPPAAPSGGYGHPSADCSTITGPGMSGGGPPNCGPTGNGIGAQPGQSRPTTTNRQAPDSARQPATQQWTPGATAALPTNSDGTPYDPSDIVDPSNPQFKERCLVVLQKLAPHSTGPDWLEHEMARSHCYVDGTPMSKRDQLKFELQKQDPQDVD